MIGYGTSTDTCPHDDNFAFRRHLLKPPSYLLYVFRSLYKPRCCFSRFRINRPGEMLSAASVFVKLLESATGKPNNIAFCYIAQNILMVTILRLFSGSDTNKACVVNRLIQAVSQRLMLHCLSGDEHHYASFKGMARPSRRFASGTCSFPRNSIR